MTPRFAAWRDVDSSHRAWGLRVGAWSIEVFLGRRFYRVQRFR